jgi:hypothetical protein
LPLAVLSLETPEYERDASIGGVNPDHNGGTSMRARCLLTLAAFAAGLTLLATPPPVQAQTAKDCKNTCKSQKKTCLDNFKSQFDTDKAACGALSGPEKKQCKKAAKSAFKQNKKACAKDPTGGFKQCKTCCKGDDLTACGVSVCGDGQAVGSEECDAGAANSDTTPDACRSDCTAAACGDGVQDTGEDCDDGAGNSDTTADACRTTCDAAGCGDGVQDTGETCDDGAANSDTTADACRTTCQPAGCGDDVLDTGEECEDDSSCADPAPCGPSCTCLASCGNDVVDEGEECDGTADSGCPCDGSCLANCECLGDFSTLEFTTVPPGGTCGRINDDSAGTGTDLNPYPPSGPATLECGTLYIGGGASVQPPSPTPDGATTIFGVSCGDPTALTLTATTSIDTGSNQSCTSPGCFFGPPLPIPNNGSTAVSTCVINAIAASPPATGTINAVTGDSVTTLPLTVGVFLNGDLEGDVAGIQPCPRCVAGACTRGPNSGMACSTTTSLLTSHDCPNPGLSLPSFGVDLSPLATGSATGTGAGGDFCGFPTSQRSLGALGQPEVEYIETTGVAAGDMTNGALLDATQASVFCIPSSGAPIVDTVADLPGPGAVTLKGQTRLAP